MCGGGSEGGVLDERVLEPKLSGGCGVCGRVQERLQCLAEHVESFAFLLDQAAGGGFLARLEHAECRDGQAGGQNEEQGDGKATQPERAWGRDRRLERMLVFWLTWRHVRCAGLLVTGGRWAQDDGRLAQVAVRQKSLGFGERFGVEFLKSGREGIPFIEPMIL